MSIYGSQSLIEQKGNSFLKFFANFEKALSEMSQELIFNSLF